MIKRSSIDNLAASIDISDLISSYVPLKKNGVHSYVGLCPFHDDRSPSMHVSSDKGLYHCFACGAGGNIFKFIMEIENIDFASAVEKIADMYNISLEYSKNDNTKDYKSAANVLNELNASYKLALFSQDGARALKYLKERGINDAMIERFELGWAGSSAKSIACLQNANIAPSLALKAGAIKQNQKGYYASFIERISFPIYNHIGTLVGFGGRTISGHLAKYVNSPQSEIFDKSRILYGYDKAKNEIFKRKEMIICEGYMDCIMLHLAGFTNAVAVLGTALTPKHLPLIKKENIKVILSFDSDTAGENAAFKSAGAAFSKPASENRIAVRINVRATKTQECTWNGTKNSETAVTRMPTHRPRATPPPTKPAMITCVGTGATSSSSILRWNLALKNDDATLA